MNKDDVIKIAEDWKNRVSETEKTNRNEVKLYLEYFQSVEPRLNSIGYSTDNYKTLANSLL